MDKDLNNTFNQFNPTDIYRALHDITRIYIHFKYTWDIYQVRSYSGTQNKSQSI